jgi:uncharacterized protein (UPF0335 family)
MQLQEAIKQAIERIMRLEERKERLSQSITVLREKDMQSFGIKGIEETALLQNVPQIELNEKVAGVDSGFMGKSFHSVDVILIRAMGALFEYNKGLLKHTEFYPNFFKFPEPFILTDALEKDEFNCAKSLYRLKEEVGLANEMIEKFKPDFMFLDGSIIPQHADRPRSGSKVTQVYHNVLNQFQQLYETAEKNKCCLIGAVEDSRGTRFRGLLQEFISREKLFEPSQLDNFFDSTLLDSLLQPKERSLAFPYASKVEKHPILNDFKKDWAEKIHVLYLKPSQFDFPLRVEFLNQKKVTEQANKVAAITLALSSLHKEYAYPSVLIEADLRARLKPEEINLVFDKLADKSGKRFFINQRRDKRPFN